MADKEVTMTRAEIDEAFEKSKAAYLKHYAEGRLAKYEHMYIVYVNGVPVCWDEEWVHAIYASDEDARPYGGDRYCVRVGHHNDVEYSRGARCVDDE